MRHIMEQIPKIFSIVAITALCWVSMALPVQAATWKWDAGAGTGKWSDSASDKNNWKPNSNPTTISGVTPKVVFNDQFVGSGQFVSIKDSDKTIHKLTLKGQYKYTLDDYTDSTDLIFDSGSTGGSSLLRVASSASGSSDHEIWIEMTLNNDLEVRQQVTTDLRLRDKINLNSNTITFNNVGTVRTQDDITGTGNMIKNNSGTVEIEGATTFTGDVTVNAGTLKLQDHDSLEEVSNVIVNGGTLLEECSFAINNDAHMTLAGGTYELAYGVDETMNSLTLTDDSTIRLGSGNNTLTYNSGVYTSGLLTIDDWDGLGTGGGNDQIIFNTTLSSDFLANVYWQDLGITGAKQLATGEIVPVPEPATLLAGGLMSALAGADLWRRHRKNKGPAPS